MVFTDFQTVGSRILHLRRQLQMTQEELAYRAHLSARKYADMERGNLDVRLETFLKLCKALNVSPDDLLLVDRSTEPVSREHVIEQVLNSSDADLNMIYRIINTINERNRP